MAKDNLELNKLGKCLAEFRHDAGLSQEQLSFKSGLYRTYIGMVERGERNLTFLTLLKLSKALNVKLSSILEKYEQHRQ